MKVSVTLEIKDIVLVVLDEKFSSFKSSSLSLFSSLFIEKIFLGERSVNFFLIFNEI